ncbi:MAG TPA: sugar phosphate isomerase/epimerase [Saprospiraceae bacterium]|nr:sugar phosphate isomerase/epimerase [Saprospiraceae bacterium]
MKRREFIINTTAASIPLFLPSKGLSLQQRYKFGLQLFTLNREMNDDPIGTLKIVQKIGFEDCELFGFDGEKQSFYGIGAKDFKKIMEDHSLTASSGHFGFAPYFDHPDDALLRFTDQCIQGAHELGMSYVTWPFLSTEHRSMSNFLKLTNKLNKIGKRVKQAGLSFAYHNHGFEFIEYNSVTGYDLILNETDPELVKLQLDIYWVIHSSKYTPKQLIKKHPGRFTMWHIKDMDKVSKDYTELGNGSIDYTSILPDPVQSGMEYYYLEQGGNFAHSAVKSVEESALYFERHLKKYF